MCSLWVRAPSEVRSAGHRDCGAARLEVPTIRDRSPMKRSTARRGEPAVATRMWGRWSTTTQHSPSSLNTGMPGSTGCPRRCGAAVQCGQSADAQWSRHTSANRFRRSPLSAAPRQGIQRGAEWMSASRGITAQKPEHDDGPPRRLLDACRSSSQHDDNTLAAPPSDRARDLKLRTGRSSVAATTTASRPRSN
jgi:hypothetical protein